MPIVATGVGGVPTIVQHGVQGILVPPNDEYSLAAAMGRLLTDPETAQQMGAAARAEALVRHSRARIREQILGAYRC